MNCDTCKYKRLLVKWDYTHGGCKHTDYPGYACTALAHEGVIIHMIGNDPQKEFCEMYAERRTDE